MSIPFSSNNPGAIVIEGHIQGLSNTRSLGETGIIVYVVDKKDCVAKYSKYCKKFFRCPDYIKDEFADFLVMLAKQENLRNWSLFPSNDHALLTISKHKVRLEKYYKIVTPNLEIINNIYNKSKLLNIAQRKGIPIPETWYFESFKDDFPENLTFPVIIKGCYGLTFYKTFGRKAYFANDENELRAQLEMISAKFSIKEILTQELIPFDGSNKTISFTAFCVEGNIKTYWMGVKLREHPIQFGTATFAKSVYIKECLAQSKPLLRELYYTGVCEIEYLYDPLSKKYKLIEINARTWLWVGLAKSCGINYALIVYNYLNSFRNVYPDEYLIDIYWINRITDSLFALKAIILQKLSLFEYFKSMNNKKVQAAFSYSDILPPIVFPFLSISRAWHIINKKPKS